MQGIYGRNNETATWIKELADVCRVTSTTSIKPQLRAPTRCPMQRTVIHCTTALLSERLRTP
jgi:hypothetical protein